MKDLMTTASRGRPAISRHPTPWTGAELASIRTARGWTQAELAIRIRGAGCPGTCASTVSRWEHGHEPMGWPLVVLARALRVAPRRLFPVAPPG